MVDLGVVCLLAAVHNVGPIVHYRELWAATSLRRGTTVNASQLPIPRLYSAAVQDCKWRYKYIYYLFNNKKNILVFIITNNALLFMNIYEN